MGNSMELVLGKKFKLEVWEAIVQKMALNEVASFKVHKSVGIFFFKFINNFETSKNKLIKKLKHKN